MSSGISTTNSFINDATFQLRTTLAANFLIPNTSSGTSITMSSFTLTWHPKRQPSAISFLEKCGFSVGRISPPPSLTIHLHWIQVPPPPQADGKNILLSPRVDNSVLPDETSTSVSPLINSFTGPEGIKRALTPRSIPTKTKVMAKKTTMLAIMTVISICL